MPRVLMLYEDATCLGLHQVLRAAAQARRKEASKPPILFLEPWACKANSKLVAQCRSYSNMRFSRPHLADHVFAVMDARGAEGVIPSLRNTPPPASDGELGSLGTRCDKWSGAVVEYLHEIAMESVESSRRAGERHRMHPHALVWERESVILAGADTWAAARGIPVKSEWQSSEGLLQLSNPTRVLVEAFRGSGRSYKKAVDGRLLLQEIAGNAAGLPGLLSRLPSLERMVTDLTSLP
jgi:hypothetical protein